MASVCEKQQYIVESVEQISVVKISGCSEVTAVGYIKNFSRNENGSHLEKLLSK